MKKFITYLNNSKWSNMADIDLFFLTVYQHLQIHTLISDFIYRVTMVCIEKKSLKFAFLPVTCGILLFTCTNNIGSLLRVWSSQMISFTVLTIHLQWMFTTLYPNMYGKYAHTLYQIYVGNKYLKKGITDNFFWGFILIF